MPLPLKSSNTTGVPQAARKIKKAKIGVNKEARSIKAAKIGVHSAKIGKIWVKNRCQLMSEIWEKMGNPVPFERVMGPNRHNIENYGDLQSIAQSMQATLCHE